jgi:predicted CoA-binding protein
MPQAAEPPIIKDPIGMALDGLDDAAIAAVLRDTRRIALVGASARPDRPSNRVMQVLLRQGYVVTPVNPGLAGQVLHGCPVVAALDDAGPLDMVDVFRASAEAGAVVDAAIRLGARTVWLQLGVIDGAAVGRARAAGLRVVMDRCPAIELPRLGIVSDETGRFT